METKKLFTISQVLTWLFCVSVIHQTDAVTAIHLIICENDRDTIDCAPGTTNIVDSQYGRSAPGSVACNHSSIRNTSCLQNQLVHAQGECQGKQTCTLRSRFSPDPCPGTFKYLNVTYTCILPVETTTVTRPIISTTTTTSDGGLVVGSTKTASECQDGTSPAIGTFKCHIGTYIVITRAFCLGFEYCNDFDESSLASCPVGETTTIWNNVCSGRHVVGEEHDCQVACSGICPVSRQGRSSYLYAEYQCVEDELFDDSPTIATTTSPSAPSTTTPAPTYSPTSLLETTTTTTMTPAARTATSRPVITTNEQPTTTNASTTMNETLESTSPATTKHPSPEAAFEEFLAECFGNATTGEADVKPYRPLTFTSPGENADSRLMVNFQSESLQTKPVKLAVAAFSEPSQSDECRSAPEPVSNDTTDDIGDDVDNEPESAASRAIDSVVNLAVFCFNGAPLHLKDGEYVDVVFPAKIDFDNEVPICTSMRGAASDWKWTTEGCRVVYSNYTHVTCRCDHLAAIALERGPKGFVVGYVNTIALLLIEKILGGISIICLLVIVLLYYILGNQHSQLAKVQLHIVMSCCLAHVMYLVGMQATGNLYVCAAMAAVLQYLFTVYAIWLVVQTALFSNTCYIHGKTREGLHAALIAPKTFNLELVPLKKIFLAVWGLPLFVVGILYKEYPHAYGTPENCWLVDTYTPYKIFIAITALGLLANITLSVITGFFMIKIDRQSDEDDEDYEEWIERLKGLITWCLPTSVVLSVVLLLSWILNAAYQNQSSLALDYLFTFCLNTQGILIFVFYCAFNPQLRKAHANHMGSSDNKIPDKETDD